jgi:hypothetical protein
MLENLGMVVSIGVHALCQSTRYLLAFALLIASAASQIPAQTVQLRTSDTQIVVEAGTNRPRLVSLEIPGQPKWENSTEKSQTPVTIITDTHSAMRDNGQSRRTTDFWRMNPRGELSHLFGLS